MTHAATNAAPPAAPPLDYQSPDPPRRFEWQAVVAWIVIIGCVTFVMVRIAREYQKNAKQGGENPTNQMRVKVAGRAAVGFKQLIADSGTKSPPPDNMNTLVLSMEQSAHSPAERLRAITVIAEVAGRDEAIKRLDLLEHADHPASMNDDLAALQKIYAADGSAIDEATRQRLVDRYDFFGRLAVTFNKPASDPERGAVLEEARQAAKRLVIAGGVGMGVLILVGIAVIVAIILISLNKIRLAYVPQRRANSAYVEVFAIYLAGFLLLSAVLRHFEKIPLAWEWIALIFIPISMIWIRLRGASFDQARFGLGWYRGRGALIEIPMGIFGYLACAPIVAAGLVTSLILSEMVGATPTHPIQQMLGGNSWEIVNLFGLACVMAPILEETMFRGALFNHLRRRWNWPISALVVAFFFAAIHPQGWTMIPALGSIAIVLAAIREWRGSLIASMAAHATNNGIVLALALLATR